METGQGKEGVTEATQGKQLTDEALLSSLSIRYSYFVKITHSSILLNEWLSNRGIQNLIYF